MVGRPPPASGQGLLEQGLQLRAGEGVTLVAELAGQLRAALLDHGAQLLFPQADKGAADPLAGAGASVGHRLLFLLFIWESCF